MTQKTCYYCGAAASSVEHVPPKAIFPESKDAAPLVDLRKNLVTVPSCTLHNESVSKDDEYVAGVLWSTHGNNEAGQVQIKKLQRMASNGRGLVKLLAQNYQRDPNSVLGTLRVDVSRFISVFEKVIRGVYFHSTKTALPSHASYNIVFPTLKSDDPDLQPVWATLLSSMAQIPEDKWKLVDGFENPLAFTVEQVIDIEPPIYYFAIYDSFEAIAIPRSFTLKP